MIPCIKSLLMFSDFDLILIHVAVEKKQRYLAIHMAQFTMTQEGITAFNIAVPSSCN
jgi:hypothetical protein